MPTLEETANRHMIVPNNPPHRPDETEKLSAATNPSTNQSEHSAVDTPERPRFTTYGAAFKHGFLGGRYKVAGRTVPIIPKNFVNSVGRMLGGMGELGLNILKESAKEFALPGSSEGYQMARFVVTELIKEILTPLPQEARQAFREYFKAQERGAPTEEIQRLKEHFDRLAAEADPISTEIGRLLGDEVFYFTDRQKLIDKIAHEPAEVFSDVVAAVAAIMTAGASVAAVKAPRLAKMLQTGAKVAKSVDIQKQ